MITLENKTLKGRYRIERLIGRGGMAEVYQAWDSWRNYHVAIKLMREDLAEDLEFVRRFKREASALAALAHDNIVRFYSFERQDLLAFIVMDYVEGTTLRSEIARANGPLALGRTLAVLAQVCAALHYAHMEGVLHRDVKPGNIMIRTDPAAGTGGRVLVADFGIAKAVDAATATTVMPGTPAYMSPEQCRSELLDVRTDVYSLGVVAYEMLAGRRPFLGETADITTGSTREKIRWEQIHAAPPPLREFNPTLPPAAEAVVMRALSKTPEARWATVLDFGRALEAALGGDRPEPVLTPPPEAAIPAPARAAAPPPAPAPSPTPKRDPIAAAAPEPVAAPAPETPSAPGGSWLRRLPAWAWAAGGLALTMVILMLVIGLGGGNNERPTPAPAGEMIVEMTETPTWTPTPGPVVATDAPSATKTPVTPATAPPQPTESATATPTATSVPTATPAPSRTPSVTPSATPTSPPMGEVTSNVLNVRAGPGTVYDVVGQLSGGELVEITARTADSGWLQIEYKGDFAWVSAGLMEASWELNRVPVNDDIPPTPTPRPNPNMVYVEAGEFLMGEEKATVYVDAFWIDRTEVTVAAYRRCVEAGQCEAASTCSWGNPNYDDPDKLDHPIVCVSWYDAQAYCAWVGKRLPTDIEWEKAARGTDGRTYPWGEGISCSQANYRDCGVGDTRPAGSYPAGASPYGALDMAGNVWEWTAEKVLRGGSWDSVEWNLRSAHRRYFDPVYTNNVIGFRCVVVGAPPGG